MCALCEFVPGQLSTSSTAHLQSYDSVLVCCALCSVQLLMGTSTLGSNLTESSKFVQQCGLGARVGREGGQLLI